MEMNVKRAKIMGIVIAFSFLLIHLFIINVFAQCDVAPMVKFNIFSVIFYAFMIIASCKEWFRLYAVGVYLEVVAHMTLAVIYTGWDNGFQVTLLGMSVLAFYAEYVGRTIKIKHIPMFLICIIGMSAYIGSYIYIYFNGYKYKLPEKANFGLTLIWAAITFIITICVLQIFVLIVNASENKLEHQMSHDKLTSLPNRYFFSNYIESIDTKSGLKDYWIAIADIDDFKHINDTYGHNCGDYVLATISDIFRREENVLCCRWGGEEFIFISSGKNGVKWGYDLLDYFRTEIEKYEFLYNGETFHVTITIGMSLYNDTMNTDSWLSRADAKLYEGKQSGKNKIVI